MDIYEEVNVLRFQEGHLSGEIPADETGYYSPLHDMLIEVISRRIGLVPPTIVDYGASYQSIALDLVAKMPEEEFQQAILLDPMYSVFPFNKSKQGRKVPGNVKKLLTIAQPLPDAQSLVDSAITDSPEVLAIFGSLLNYIAPDTFLGAIKNPHITRLAFLNSPSADIGSRHPHAINSQYGLGPLLKGQGFVPCHSATLPSDILLAVYMKELPAV